jgi:CDK-activating kinase assembly factor MAT1
MWPSFVSDTMYGSNFILVNEVYLKSCDHCIKREFQHSREINCPSCQKPVKKSQLQDKTIEELNFTKETAIRKKVLKE